MSGPRVGDRLSDDDLLCEGRPAVHRVVGSASTGVRGQTSSAADLRRRHKEIRLGNVLLIAMLLQITRSRCVHSTFYYFVCAILYYRLSGLDLLAYSFIVLCQFDMNT
ncbi:uncharacterized protein LOC119273453 isoform X1 [Triticum dicoccoides]|uniref:uncharacterized protein LOC119273453 isoform X1 n=1 Tax=Triticum dicoccoides TaxID=85692 RepID=UPI000E7C6D0B|nr:uncharacterized protein LOC119273453 isoform X1 [Triticum dicoccoides]